MLMAIGMILVGGLALWVGVDERRTTTAIAQHGKRASATVDKVTWTQKGRVTKSEYSFHAEVHFATERGVISTKLEISDERGRALRDQLRDGKEPVLQVIYLPEQVASVRLANLADDSRLFLGFGFVLVALGIGFFLWLSVIKSREAAY